MTKAAVLLHHLARAGGAALLIATPGAAQQKAAVPSEVPAASAADVLAHVDPMVGTGEATGVVGEINNFPGPSMPFGMVQLSPDTLGAYAGYRHSHNRVRGFSVTHASAGCNVFGDVPILPIIGEVGGEPWNRTERFSHARERAEVGRYGVTLLDSGIDVELSAATRAGGLRFAFPKEGAASVLVNAGGSLSKVSTATVELTGPRTVSGSVTAGQFCGKPNRHTLYYTIEFDQDVRDVGTWRGQELSAGRRAATGQRAGAWLSFAPGSVVKAKIGISYVDQAGAQANLAADMPGWDFDRIRGANRDAWRALLGKVQVEGGARSDRTMFYTSLYQAMLHPNTFNDVDGRYIGFDSRVHRVAPGRAQYANVSDWDTYRSLGALQAVLEPRRASDIAQSLVNDAVQGGWLPRWPVANQYTGQMTGDSSVPLIASMYAFGARDFDAETALRYMKKGATSAAPTANGYIQRRGIDAYQRLHYGPQTEEFRGDHQIVGTSITLEWSIADFAIGRFAAALGDRVIAREYLGRGAYWRNVFDPERRIMSARAADGRFLPGSPNKGFGQPGFDEGNDEQYTWMVPHDVAGLTAALGGREAAVARLDRFVTELNAGPNSRHLWIGNEPNFGVPWLYDYLGRPWRTSELVDRLIARLFKPEPNGKPGNDDLGAQAGWYVWAAMGIYPATPGTDVLALNTPRFDQVSLRLASGRMLRLRAPGASVGKRYIVGARVNGRSWNRAYLPATLIHDGGTLDLILAERPDLTWGASPSAAPPSFYP